MQAQSVRMFVRCGGPSLVAVRLRDPKIGPHEFRVQGSGLGLRV